MNEFPYRLEYRRVNGEENVPYIVHTGNNFATRGTEWEIILFNHIAALEAEVARLRRLLADAGIEA
jgi:hypothetical protein